jgi:hypothetical protein
MSEGRRSLRCKGSRWKLTRFGFQIRVGHPGLLRPGALHQMYRIQHKPCGTKFASCVRVQRMPRNETSAFVKAHTSILLPAFQHVLSPSNCHLQRAPTIDKYVKGLQFGMRQIWEAGGKIGPEPNIRRYDKVKHRRAVAKQATADLRRR